MATDSAFLRRLPIRGEPTNELQERHTNMTSRRDFKRRKRRAAPHKRKDKGIALARGATRGAGLRKLLSVFIFVNASLRPASRLASANEMVASEPVPSDAPQAQPLVYNLLMREFGSGDGSFTGAGRAGANSRLDFSSSSAPSSSWSSSSVSPSLIESRCWNNYEDDNDCKQLNVITAPNADELLRHKQQQQQQQSAHSDQFGADNIITPVVIFEAASTIEPESEPEKRHRLSTGQPLHETGAQPQQQRNRPNDLFASPPQTATILPVLFERPVTRPSSKNSVIYVATPQPEGKPGTRTKGTAAGRKCRDQDDADCDEPEEAESSERTAAGSSGGRDENEPGEPDGGRADRDHNSTGSRLASTTGGPLESGSGGFAPSDDNEDATDDDDDDSDNDKDNDHDHDHDHDHEHDNEDSNGDANAIDESSGSLPPQPDESTPRLLEVSTVAAGEPGSSTDGEMESASGGPSAGATSELPSSSAKQQTGAEIEVVVHSTLPASFASSTRGAHEPATSTTGEPATQPPDDVFTSRPIFPPSSEAPASSSSSSSSANRGPADDEAASAAGEPSTTPELDLYTFKPIPIPVEEGLPRYGQRQQQFSYEHASTKPSSGGGGEQQEVNSQNIFKRPPMHESGRSTFDDGWTTRMPVNQQSLLLSARDQVGQFQPPDRFTGTNQKRVGPGKGHMGTDMLPTLLLYASIIVLVTTALIFAIMVYVFWRRNTTRRQNLLQKARMMNGQPPHAGHLAPSMSHASQLHGGPMAPAGQPQGLLSTYAPGKGMSTGKVTTSIAKPASERDRKHFEDDEDESAHEINGEGARSFNNKNNSKDHLVEGGGDDDEASIATGNQADTSESNFQARAPPLNSAGGQANQQSWSTDEPTTSSGGGAGPSRTRDNQQSQHLLDGLSRAPHYPNSLSDGRQNSSSISDSQCSPDASIERAPALQAAGPSQSHSKAGLSQGPQPNSRQQMMQSPRLVGPAYGPQMLIRPVGAYPKMANGNGWPLSRAAYAAQPLMVTPNGFGAPPKGRPTASRSIENLQLSASSSHVHFVGQPMATQQQVPYVLQDAQMGQPAMLAYSMRGARPQNQLFSSPQHQAYPAPYNLQVNSNQPMISPQRIAMSPLATLGRRYPPGAGLSRNIYSEDSSSFMTTSPSLARTSSSSSFAFNLAKHQPSESPSSIASINSIKAKPLLEPTSGRVINDYTMQAQFDARESNGTGSAPGPPIFGRQDRSEAWYV